MPKTITLTHDYPYPAADVWHVATDFACFAEAMKGVATFEGMPSEGRLAADQVFDVKVRLLGWMPAMDYHMALQHFDNDAMTFTSNEHGGSIKSWVHELSVQATETGARLTDKVTVDAGLMTPLMGLWVRFVYGKRHAPRLRMLEHRRHG